jgi:aryl-alcohol dehydrogenase-like predicted oxidoreductase
MILKTDFRRYAPHFSKENFPKNLELFHQLTAIAKKKNGTPGQLTLAWILAQGDDSIPIPGRRKIKNLGENAAATQNKLTKQEVEEIRQTCEKLMSPGDVILKLWLIIYLLTPLQRRTKC